MQVGNDLEAPIAKRYASNIISALVFISLLLSGCSREVDFLLSASGEEISDGATISLVAAKNDLERLKQQNPGGYYVEVRAGPQGVSYFSYDFADTSERDLGDNRTQIDARLIKRSGDGSLRTDSDATCAQIVFADFGFSVASNIVCIE